MVNSLENFGCVFDRALEGKFIDRMDQNQDISARHMNDRKFAKVVADFLRKQVYEQMREEVKQDAAQSRMAPRFARPDVAARSEVITH